MTLTPEAEVTRSSFPVTEALSFGIATKLWNKSKAFNTGDFITLHNILSVTVNEDVCRMTTCQEYFKYMWQYKKHIYNSTTVFWKRNCSAENKKQPYILVALLDLLEPICQTLFFSTYWNIIPNVHLCVPSSHMAKHNSLICHVMYCYFPHHTSYSFSITTK